MSFDPADAFEYGESECCGARVLLGDMCFECGEHCEVIDPLAKEEIITPTQTQPKIQNESNAKN